MPLRRDVDALVFVLLDKRAAAHDEPAANAVELWSITPASSHARVPANDGWRLRPLRVSAALAAGLSAALARASGTSR